MRKLITLTGPTASGKNALAMAIAENLGGTIINADSMQIYRELPILTAQPILSEDEAVRIPHRLYGIISGRESFSVASWLELAQQEINASWQAGRVAMIVGGSGMYLQRLLKGLAPMPAISEKIRLEAEEIITSEHLSVLHARLHPDDKIKLHPNDKARIIRSYSIYRESGKSLSFWQQNTVRPAILEGAKMINIAIMPERGTLYARCNQRLEEMFAQGCVAEIEKIAHYPAHLPICHVIGFMPIKNYLCSQINYDKALMLAQQQTRNYAKRQYSWIRHQFQADIILNDAASENLVGKLKRFFGQ